MLSKSFTSLSRAKETGKCQRNVYFMFCIFLYLLWLCSYFLLLLTLVFTQMSSYKSYFFFLFLSCFLFTHCLPSVRPGCGQLCLSCHVLRRTGWKPGWNPYSGCGTCSISGHVKVSSQFILCCLLFSLQQELKCLYSL